MSEQPGVALVVTAHPDDVDFGAGATVASWVEQGWEVHYCVCTDGDAGGFDPAVDRSEIPGIRRSEQRRAAKCLGVSDVRFLSYPDGALANSLALRRDITRVIRELRPRRIISQSPRRNLDRIRASHPDHLAAGEATLCAVYPDARNPFAFPELAAEGLDAHVVEEVWLMADPHPDRFVEVTAHFDAKVAALCCHESQLEQVKDPARLLGEWMAKTARTAGMAEGSLAEAFRFVDTR